MSTENTNIERMYLYASNCRLQDFENLFSELEIQLSADDRREALLMRAQIKLFAADATFLSDLALAAELGAASRFRCLNQVWLSDAPNRFNVFPEKAGALQTFLQMLPRAEKLIDGFWGSAGRRMVRQIRSEILYFTGSFGDALELIREQQETVETCTEEILHQCMLFRCCLAPREPRKAEQCMLNMIRISKEHPECVSAYQAVRRWANLTTGWTGETPRFYDDSAGEELPVLEDRREAIRMGFARTTPLEKPFVEYAERHYANACTIRQCPPSRNGRHAANRVY
ncbi:MAG: hypothetical protein ACK5LX_08720 [Oscillospiraceae bacterium]